MRDIRDMALKELEGVLAEWGYPAFRAKQIYSWLYKRGVAGFESMSDLPEALRQKLKHSLGLSSLSPARRFESKDKTKKFLFRLRDGNHIESVSIPAQKRLTCCISSQVGCKFSCVFCASGMGGFKRDLSCAELLAQLLYLKSDSPNKEITHIVFMGTGEPLDNYENVLKAIRIINAREGLGIGARRITISTCGIIPGIKRLATEGMQVELSVSLHAPDDKTRSLLVPANKKFPLAELIPACREYIENTGRQITFEYILIKGINSGLQNAQSLCRILKGMNCKVNLIPANPVAEYKVMAPEKREIAAFQDYLGRHNVKTTLRVSRGKDINAACGQLRLGYEKK